VQVGSRTVPTVHRRPSGAKGSMAAAGTGLNNGDFADGLMSWTTTILGGGASPGEVRVENEQALLLEGDSFLITLSQSFVVKDQLASMSFDLFFTPGFDQTDPFIPDAFEVSLLDGSFQSVVPTWHALATSFVNFQEDFDDQGDLDTQRNDSWFGGPGVLVEQIPATTAAVAGLHISVDLTGVATGTNVTLYFDLIGADADMGSGVTIDNVTTRLQRAGCATDADCPPDPAECFQSYCDPAGGLCKLALIADGGVAGATLVESSDSTPPGPDESTTTEAPGQIAGIRPAPSANRVSISEKGSLLYYSKIELRWNATAPYSPRQDTFLTIVNDYPEDVYVQWYFINGDSPSAAVFAGSPLILVERAHRGWNQVDCTTELSANKSTYMSALSGGPLGCQPFSILDPGIPPGRPDPENPGQRILRGYAIAFAVDSSGNEISWNHLSGSVDIVNYADLSAWEYNAFAFQCIYSPNPGDSCGTDPGTLHMNGVEYDFAFDKLLFDFYAVGSEAFSLPPSTFVTLDTDLTLYPVSVDLRQDNAGPTVTKAKFDIWNQNEDGLSGTYRCISCWDQTLLCSYGPPNSFLITNLHTDKGKARIDGLQSDVCNSPELCCHLGVDQACFPAIDHPQIDAACSKDAAILGVADKVLYFSGSATGRTDAGMTLVGQGAQEAVIYRDIISPPEPLTAPSQTGRERLPIENGTLRGIRKTRTR